jgi:D-serine deaminase-like pyridoxal phosphate-dependent protein
VHPPLDLGWLSRVAVDPFTKGFPAVSEPVPLLEVGSCGWSMFEDLQPPMMVLRDSALRHNIEVMAAYCREHGVDLAPHGKTTMAPQLFDRQLRAGAWGITAASAGQARVMREAGVARVLLANEVVDELSIAWIAEQLSDPSFELVCYVDSAAGVEMLAEHLARARSARPQRVLVELGSTGGRTGCRSISEALEIATLVRSSDALELAGVAGYEGTICRERTSECLSRVGAFVDELRALTMRLLEDGAFEGASEVVVTAGGSAFFDVVVERLAGGWASGPDVRVVLRSGCYLTHDSGYYEALSPLSVAADRAERFLPAIEIWGSVLSKPEPELAILNVGKRDVSFDLGLPEPNTVRARSGETVTLAGELEIFDLNDQHAFCRVFGGVRLEVGDLVGCGISHPCAAFERWRVLPVVDDDGVVVEAVATFF